MKSLVKTKFTAAIYLVILFLFAANTLSAKANPSELVLKKVAEKSFSLQLNYQQNTDIEITLKDRVGIVLWKESMENTKQYSKKCDLVNLPDGIYFLEIEDNRKVKSRRIDIIDNELAFIEEGESIIYKPVISQEKSKLLLSLYSPDSSEIEVLFRDENDHVLYRESLKDHTKIEKSFDISRLPSGQYVLLTKTKGRYFPYQISL